MSLFGSQREWPVPQFENSIPVGATFKRLILLIVFETRSEFGPQLRDTNASTRWISAEPLLGSLADLELDGIAWLVAGGESGPGAREMQAIWVRELRDKCVADGVFFFFKQWGGPTSKGGGDKAVLDGRRWLEYPDVCMASIR